MFDHIGIGVTDYEASKAFFLEALKPIGVGVVMEGKFGGPDGHNVEVVCHKPA